MARPRAQTVAGVMPARGARRVLATFGLRVGRTIVGILPFARRGRAANDPKA
jgi:hypothetical protein